jgi:hypothetical protein
MAVTSAVAVTRMRWRPGVLAWTLWTPVLLGDGIRFFNNLSNAPVALEGPTIVEGTGVTHLIYRVRSR